MMEKKGKVKQPLRKIIRNNAMMMGIVMKTYPLYLILLVFETVKNRILIFIEHTWGIKFILESAEFGWPFQNVAYYLVGFIFIMLLNMIWSVIYLHFFEAKGKELANKKLKLMLYEKANDIDLSCYDDPKYYNDFVLSVAESEKCLQRTMDNLKNFCDGFTMLVTTGVFMLFNDLSSIVFVLLSFGIQIVGSQALNKVIYRVRLKLNPLERKRSYIHRVFYLSDYAKEVRLNPEITGKLEEDFAKTNQEIYNVHKANGSKRSWLSFTTWYISGEFILGTLYLIYLVFKAAVLHTISYSSVVVLSGAVYGFRYGMQSMADLLPKLTENSLYVQKLEDFMATEKKVVSKQSLPVPDHTATLELRHVSFAYNETDGNVLTDVNMTIHPYEKIALVGYNGAGKTTLIKLMMRLYDPTEGQILLDGVDIREYDVEEYRKKLGAVFQDYKLYAATVAENVVMDDKSPDRDAVLLALEQSGFSDRLQGLELGLDTPLTTEFEEAGINLSGGEAQKIAIARVFYHAANMIILDEPSSALDPIAEYRLNGAMLEAANHKTVVFISHRLSTTRDADKIYMLENGRIIESGRHSELLEQKGKYAQMWHAQAGQYAKEAV